MCLDCLFFDVLSDLLDLLEGVAAGNFQDLAGDHLGLFAGEKENGFGNVFRLDEFA